MKSDVMPSIVQMEPEVLKNLVKEVRETVAMNVVLSKKMESSFGIADLWNIHRNSRTKMARMRFRG